jgi:hypothetical protein
VCVCVSNGVRSRNLNNEAAWARVGAVASQKQEKGNSPFHFALKETESKSCNYVFTFNACN